MTLSIAWGNGNAEAGSQPSMALTVANTLALNSSSYTHLVAHVKHEGTPTTLTMSDNKGSGTWNSLTKIDHSNGDLSAQLQWVKIGTPGTDHEVTVTFGAAREFSALAVWLINSTVGNIVVDAQANDQGTSSTPADGGSLATSGAAVVCVYGIGPYSTRTWTPGTGWTEAYEGLPTASPSVSVTGGHRGPETTTPIDPFATPSSALSWILNSVAFREASGGTTVGSQVLGGRLMRPSLIGA